MALAVEPTYSNFDQFKARTPVSAQTAIAEADWKPFALRAENIIDTYVNIPALNRFALNQDLKFPVKDINGNSLMPDDVTLAAIEITSDLILKGDAVAENGVLDTSESWDGAGYSVGKIRKNISSSEDIKIYMPPLARRLLMPWTNKVARLTY